MSRPRAWPFRTASIMVAPAPNEGFMRLVFGFVLAALVCVLSVALWGGGASALTPGAVSSAPQPLLQDAKFVCGDFGEGYTCRHEFGLRAAERQDPDHSGQLFAGGASAPGQRQFGCASVCPGGLGHQHEHTGAPLRHRQAVPPTPSCWGATASPIRSAAPTPFRPAPTRPNAAARRSRCATSTPTAPRIAAAGPTASTRPCTHKKASVEPLRCVRFTPDSGREASPLKESAKCQQTTLVVRRHH